MLSQIIGLDNDTIVNEGILGFLVTLDSTDENQVPKIQVAKFLPKETHTELVNLSTLKHFIYQKNLIHLFFHYNQDHFSNL